MQRSAGEHALVLNYLQSATFCCRTLSEARELANGLSRFCPAPQRAVLGLHELLINAIEHGNLGISYEEKKQLVVEGRWHEEIERRLIEPAYRNRIVTVALERDSDGVHLTIRDEGNGFAWADYLDISPQRVFDPHGRGIAMSRMVSVDAIEYQGNGNTVKVTFHNRRPSGSGDGEDMAGKSLL